MPTPSAATESCTHNPIVCENELPGTPADEWDIQGAGDETLQGFATDISVNVGGTVSFKVDTTAATFGIEIYRLGWYGGNGARRVDVIPTVTGHRQQACRVDAATELRDCGNWTVSTSWMVPPTAVSGVYLAKLTRDDTGGGSHIPFVVRADNSTSELFFQTADTTWQAYNTFGGSNFYYGGANGRAYKLSYNRPFTTRRDNSGRDFLFSNEYPMIRFLERNGYDVSYTTGVDSDRLGGLIKNHKIFLSVGHDEYWSGNQRANVEAARDSGVHLAFFAGNEVYWKTRWEPSQDGSGTPYRTLVCYKESWADAKIDPTQAWTGTWRDPRFSPPSDGGRPENALVGTAYMANSSDLALQVPATYGKFRLWRDTRVANLLSGQVATLAPHTIGYESNEDIDNGLRPPGLIHLSHTTGPVPEYLRDFGRQVSPGTTTHNLTLYRAASGALAFSAGTIQWAWGLDNVHDGTRSPADPAMQQATLNLFADMGVLPASTQSGLVTPSVNTDTQGPNVTITSPASGSTFTNGAQVTVTGTATDVGGGQVAMVEVSTDAGATWRRATGTSSWSYTFTATGAGGTTVRVRGIDDSANPTSTPATRALNLTGPTSLFGSRAPTVPSAADGGSYQLGVRFTPQSDGYVTGVKFYKGSGNGGTHTGSLWSSSGARLATGTFVNETSSGWQTLTFAQRVPVIAGTTYVASYFAPQGHYAADQYFFAYLNHVAPPLVAPGASDNGVFANGDSFPTQSHRNTNYWVDVLFLDGSVLPPAIATVSPARGSGGVPTTVTPSVSFSKPVVPGSVQVTLTDSTDQPVAGTTSYDATSRTATFTPANPLAPGRTYRVGVQASDQQGRPLDPAPDWSFATDPYPSLAKLFATDAVPAIVADSDPGPVTLGVKFVPAVGGKVVGIRFYKGPGNTGVHTGTLWSANGTELGRVTFGGETAVGWQTATFSSPITVRAGSTYVASYRAPNGHYAAELHFFAMDWSRGPLTARSGGNGVYRYGSDGFPTSTFADTNYWVDPIFEADAEQPPPAAPGP
ncbi:N,N-dimethylformamidase beta subunit family domain-containing protein [Micromonospora viridifaciens]|uniref:N,N-dimethylformamidase beta subunit family domain-containing protein n=1 Tax=Micromonospora viridifaciens TaxID=1881 RepID=UPI00142E07DD|nr:N,N-dimethylformamidase beta subunit family domain-containing protein [Micromonospora viridifaciens]